MQVICCIGIKKQHEATNSEINVNIIQNGISNIALNIDRDISDKVFGAIYTIDKIQKVDIIFLNVQVGVIL